ncbi:hypothetical protein CQ13_03505 [Bradyrhizobium retamae]|uniref:Uncharacterized protein n=1 Tax=Bradyrhizobium retamae TaxID=1300035 RepID=A0A0R3N657_9BRAD|nr:hypothetical protein CQ13_03505 [Bradyrhizobium retamae]
MIVPGGGISLDGKGWISCRPGFFLPVADDGRTGIGKPLERERVIVPLFTDAIIVGRERVSVPTGGRPRVELACVPPSEAAPEECRP